jgi:hypothetical protein
MQNISPLLVDINTISSIADISTDNNGNNYSSSGMLSIPTTFTISYAVGSVIIIHTLYPSNSKTLITYHECPIIFIKHFTSSSHLMSIDSSGLCVIWQYPSLQISTTFTLTQLPSIQLTHIFHGQFRKDKLLLLAVSSYTKRNFLYEFNSYEFTFRALCCDIVQNEEVYDLKPFYNSSDLVVMTKNAVIYYHLTASETVQQFQFCFDIKFNYDLVLNSLKVSAVMNYIAFVTEKGSVLVYDQNGNGKPALIPNDSSVFTTCEFSKDLLLCGTDNGRIYCYSIYEQVLMKCVEAWQEGLTAMKEFCLCKGLNDTDVNDVDNTYNENGVCKRNKMKMSIEKVFISGECVLLINKDNSMLLMNMNCDNRGNSGNSNCVYIYGHSKELTCMTPVKEGNAFNEGTLFYTAAYDQSIQTVNVSMRSDKIVNYYLSDDIQNYVNDNTNNNDHVVFNSNNIYNNGNSNNINTNIYITALKLHPTYMNKLFAGDNKGSLYLFDLKENIFQYKKYIANTFAITSLSFDTKCEYICIGFDTGMNVLCDLNNECEYISKINDHFLSPNEIDLRKSNHQVTSFSHFLPHTNNTNNTVNTCTFLFYLKTQSEIELCSISSSNAPQPHRTIRIEGTILDINVHTSNNYSIILTQRRLIIVHSLSNGEVTAVIDVSSQIHNVYNFALDSSGLYLALLCDVKGYKGACGKKSNVVFFEIGTGKVQCYIDGVFEMNEVMFDEYGKFVVVGVGGSKGGVSLWKLPNNMKDAIYNVKEQVKADANFWEMYEIRYDDNDEDINNYYNRNYKYGNSEWGSIASRSSVNVFAGNNKDIRSVRSKRSDRDSNRNVQVENVFENNLKNSVQKEINNDEEEQQRINTLRTGLMGDGDNSSKSNSNSRSNINDHLVIEHKPKVIHDNKKINDTNKHIINHNNINNHLPIKTHRNNNNNNNNSYINPKHSEFSTLHKPQHSFKTEISSNKRYNFPSYFDNIGSVSSNKHNEVNNVNNNKKEASPPSLKQQQQTKQQQVPQNPFLNSLECSTESKQRFNKINQAIAQMLQSQHSNNNVNHKEPTDIDINEEQRSIHSSNVTESIESSVQDLKHEYEYGSDLKFSTQTFANKANKDYYINSKNITKAYPEPDDIDDIDGVIDSYNN